MFSQRRTNDAHRRRIERKFARFGADAVSAEKFRCFFRLQFVFGDFAVGFPLATIVT